MLFIKSDADCSSVLEQVGVDAASACMGLHGSQVRLCEQEDQAHPRQLVSSEHTEV